jgi:peptide/nickel transport system permease protein
MSIIERDLETGALPADEWGGGDTNVEARGYWEQVWRRFKRDKVAIGGGISIIFLVLLCFVGGPVFASILGHGPNTLFDGGLNANALPWGPWAHFKNVPYIGATGNFPTVLFPLGSDGPQGRDEFLRLLYGGQASLEVAIFATVFTILIGATVGSIAGYFGGVVDTIVSRITELVMAFPVLLFIIALASTIGDSLNNITFHGIFGRGVVNLVLILSLFGWFYPARIMRSVVLSLREKEFVEAARMTGASDGRIIRSHILPHLVAPIIVYSTLSIASFIIAEAGLSYLGVGIKLPTASWGNLLQQASDYYTTQPWLMVWPGLAVLLTTLAFNLLGDGLRDAFDPRATH